jgi:hypothetical protein
LEQYQGNINHVVPITLLDGERLRSGTPADFHEIFELASRASGLERNAHLSALLKLGESVVLERDGGIVGFSVRRRFGRGHVIGPVVALRSRDDVRARVLIGYWLSGRDDEFVRVDVPSGTSLTDWLIRQGWKRVDTVSKMVRNAPASEHSGGSDPVCRLYGLISQAML